MATYSWFSVCVCVCEPVELLRCFPLDVVRPWCGSLANTNIAVRRLIAPRPFSESPKPRTAPVRLQYGTSVQVHNAPAVANKLSPTRPASFTQDPSKDPSKGHCNVLHIKLSESALIKCLQLSESAECLRTESQAGRAQTTKKLYKLQEQGPTQR